MQEDDYLNLMNRTWARGEGKVVRNSRALWGILTWWDKRSCNILFSLENRCRLFVELEENANKEVFWVGNIYGPTVQAQKENLWTSLEDQCEGKKQIPCYIAGEFNVTISAKEHRGGAKVRDPFWWKIGGFDLAVGTNRYKTQKWEIHLEQ